jgi:putative membrane protein
MPCHHFAGGYWFLIPIACMLFMLIVGIIFIIFWKRGGIWNCMHPPQFHAPGHMGMPESPLDILKRRYALGEITKEQFEQMKKDIGI